MKAAKVILDKSGLRPSYQRLKIYSYLAETKEHPTVEQIYTDLKEEIPTLSKMTIYNTMKSFAKHNIIRVVTIEENEARFDSIVSAHGHFKCKECGSVRDFDFNNLEAIEKAIDGGTIDSVDYFVNGVCASCS